MANKNKLSYEEKQQNILLPPEDDEPEESGFARFVHALSPQQMIAFVLLVAMLLVAIILGVHAVRAKKAASDTSVRATTPVETVLPSTTVDENNAAVSPSPEVTPEPTVTPTPVPAATAAPAASTGTQSSTSSTSSTTSSTPSYVATSTYYTVTFDSDGGSYVAPVQVRAGDRVSEPAAPTRDGYRFTGWYVNIHHTAAYYFDRETVRKDMTLFAGWEPLSTSSSVPDDMNVTTPASTVQVTPEPTAVPTPEPTPVPTVEPTPEPTAVPEVTPVPETQTDETAEMNAGLVPTENTEQQAEPSQNDIPADMTGTESADSSAEAITQPEETVTTDPSAVVLTLNSYTAAQPDNWGGDLVTSTSGIPENVPTMDTLPEDITAGTYALVNANGAFLSYNGSNQICLSGSPVFWAFAGVSSSCSISRTDAENAFIGCAWDALQAGSTITCSNAQEPGTTWTLTEANGGWLIVNADRPDLCLLSDTNGFFLGTTNMATSNDLWRFVGEGDWANVFEAVLQPPYYVIGTTITSDQATASSDEAWQQLTSTGITEGMTASASQMAPVTLQPVLAGYSGKADVFSVDFYTGSLSGSTDFTLASWKMDTSEFMNRNGYTSAQTDSATLGLRVPQDGTCAFMSMPSVTFSGDGMESLTLTPTCTWPADTGDSNIAYDWQANTWYRIVVRSWTHTETETTYVGFWVENLSTGETTLLAIYDTHLPQSCMTGSFTMKMAGTDGLSASAYREMQVSNLRVRDTQAQAWVLVDHLTMTAENNGTETPLWRFSASAGVFRAEESGVTDFGWGAGSGTPVLFGARPASGELDLSGFTALGMQGYTDSAS